MKQDIPEGRKKTYVRAVCNIRPQKQEKYCVKITVGGDLIEYPYLCTTPTADHRIIKCHWNSVISNLYAKYFPLDIKNFYICHKIQRYKYLVIRADMIPDKFIAHYNPQKYTPSVRYYWTQNFLGTGIESGHYR